MTDCIATGWGSGAWGSTPWGGEPASPGGPLPTNPPFDVYCVGPCGPMSVILTYPDVQAVETGTQFFVDGTTLDLGIASGGEVPTSAAQLYITSPVPGSFTVDWTMYPASLPLNFADVPHKHVYFSVCNISGSVAGLLFSRAGIAYTGSAHVDVAGDLVLDGPLQPLPDSQDVIEEGSYSTIRIVVDAVTGVTYVYVTRTSELETYGHRLRYVLPRLASDTMRQTPVEGTMVSVRGGVDDPSRVFLDSICLGTGLVIPNIAPRAVAGSDQAIRACSVLRLDGSASFDPEGSPLTYQWRLVDAPLRSHYVFEGRDGSTVPLPIPTGFTDKFYTPSLAAVHGMDPLTPGDVLLVRGLSYVLHSVGSDGGGFFVRIEGFSLPEDMSAGEPFSLLRQRGISGATLAKPTFYPDVPGLYRFTLVVFDGALLSEPSVVVVNVTETATPRGVVPDATFVWDYLSTFWQLVEGKERIDVIWSSIVQVAAAELLSLWQIDYAKSLRDVQRTFQRRWLHYELSLTETAFEKTSVRSVPSGVSSGALVVAGTAGISGTTVLFRVRGEDYPVTFEGSPTLTAGEISDQLQAALYRVDRRFQVRTLLDRTNTVAVLRVQAPFRFSVDEGTSSLFASADSGLVHGTGSLVNPRTYCTDRVLNGEVTEGDLLVLGDRSYRIVRVVDDPSDTWRFQRVVVSTDIPSDAPTSWSIPGYVDSPTIDLESALVCAGDTAYFEVREEATQRLQEVPARAVGVSGSRLGVDVTPLLDWLSDNAFTVTFRRLLRRTYLPVDPLVVDIPYLQEKIVSTDDTEVLRRNVDFFLEEYRGTPCVRFITGTPDVWQGGDPPARLWAETTYLDNRPTIEANFGLAASFTLDDLAKLPNNVDYLSSVRGLWFAYFSGPTLANLRAGTQILLGLPFAEETGVIEEIRKDFSTQQGRLLVRDASSTEIVRSYMYPGTLAMETNPTTGELYKVGDTVEQFAPLVRGVEVADWVSNPRWFLGYLEQGSFLEVQKYFRFLVRVDSRAFDLAALLFVQAFVRRIKPTYTDPMFVVLAEVDAAEVDTTDARAYRGKLSLQNGATGLNNFASGRFDQPRPAGGGFKPLFDGPDAAHPAYEGSTSMFDVERLAPEDVIVGRATDHFAGGPFVFDSVFRWDHPTYTAQEFFTGPYAPLEIFPSPGQLLSLPHTATAPGSYTAMEIAIHTQDPVGQVFEFVLEKNGSVVTTESITPTPGGFIQIRSILLTFLIGDVLQVRLRVPGATPVRVYWESLVVTLGSATYPTYDDVLPAGDYTVYKEMS